MYHRDLNLIKSNSFLLFGSRGTGKSTLIRNRFPDEDMTTIDLLDQSQFTVLNTQPNRLEEIINIQPKEWVFIDEIQKIPALLDEVHRLIEKSKRKFILTGSSARKLKRSAANLLAGRAFVFHLFPLTHTELGGDFVLEEILKFGALPQVFSYQNDREKKLFLKAYTETYLKEEILIEQLIRKLPPFQKFLEISAAQDTGLVSYTNIGRDVDVDPKIISNYYSILEDTLLGFKLEPFHTAIRRRQKSSPKFYWFDTGVRRAMSGTIDLEVTPKSFEYGSLFESFIMNEIYKILTYSEKSFKLSFIRIDDNLEIDLIIERAGHPTMLIEIKSTDRVHEGHIQSLVKLRDKFNNKKCYLLSQDKTPRIIEGVECLPWDKFFKDSFLN